MSLEEIVPAKKMSIQGDKGVSTNGTVIFNKDAGANKSPLMIVGERTELLKRENRRTTEARSQSDEGNISYPSNKSLWKSFQEIADPAKKTFVPGDKGVSTNGTVILNEDAGTNKSSLSVGERIKLLKRENRETTEARPQSDEGNSSYPSFKSLVRQLEGKLCMLMAGCCSAITYSLIKFTKTLPVGEFTTIKAIFGIFFILPLLFSRESDIEFHGKGKFVLIRAFCGGLYILFLTWASTVMDYGDGTTLCSLYPIFAALFSRLLWKEKLSIWTLIAMIIGLSGSVLIAKPSFLFGTQDETERKSYSPYFVLVPITASVLLGFGYSFMRKIGTDVSPLLVTIIVSGFSAVDGLAFQLVCGVHTFNLPGCYLDRGLVFASGLGDCLQLLLLNRGLSLEKSAIGTTLYNSKVLGAYIIQVFVFHNVPNATSTAGAFLVLSSAVLVILDRILCKCFTYEI